MPKIIIGVMGPGEQASALDLENAYHLGQLIAQAGWVLLTGGRAVGVMDAASRGAKSAGGLTIGILPTTDSTGMSMVIDLPIFTGLGHARNLVNVLSSQVVIACGMGVGTASEIAFAIKADRPLILLNGDVISQQFFQQLAPDRVFLAQTPQEAVDRVNECLAIDD